MTDVAYYYRILELEPGASLEEVTQGYKDLAIVWHPDRFVQFPRLQQKAQEKMKQINEAKEQLLSLLSVAKVAKSRIDPPPASSRDSQPSRDAGGHSRRVRVQRPKPADYQRTLKDYIQAMESKQPDLSGWLD